MGSTSIWIAFKRGRSGKGAVTCRPTRDAHDQQLSRGRRRSDGHLPQEALLGVSAHEAHAGQGNERKRRNTGTVRPSLGGEAREEAELTNLRRFHPPRLVLAAELLEERLVDLVSDDLLKAEFAESTETARILSFNKQKKTAAKK